MASILVVDDNSEVRKVITQGLEFAGHRVHTAEDGWAALIGFRRCGADLVIVDVAATAPECHLTISEIKSLGRDVKVLAMSGGGHDLEGDLGGSGCSVGADGVLTKPFTLLDLFVAVDGLLPAAVRPRVRAAL